MRRATAAIILALVGALVVAIAGLLTWDAFRPPERLNIGVGFLGYSNDISSGRLAIILITNKSASSVVRQSRYQIQIPTDRRWTNLSTGYLHSGVLDPTTSETVTVAAPTNQTWRIRVLVRAKQSMLAELSGSVRDAARAAGLRVRPHRGNDAFHSEWVEK
jgi:hypothetical protein